MLDDGNGNRVRFVRIRIQYARSSEYVEQRSYALRTDGILEEKIPKRSLFFFSRFCREPNRRDSLSS